MALSWIVRAQHNKHSNDILEIKYITVYVNLLISIKDTDKEKCYPFNYPEKHPHSTLGIYLNIYTF